MKTHKRLDFGLDFPHTELDNRRRMISYINFKLATHGLPTAPDDDPAMMGLVEGMVQNFQQKNRLLDQYLPPADQRIQAYLDDVLGDLADIEQVPRLPGNTIVLDRYGLARELSLPPQQHEFHTDIVHSYRI